MRLISKGIFVLCFISFFSVSSYAQKEKNYPIGIVDVATIATQLPESLEADKKLKDLQKGVTDSLQKMQDSFQKRVDAYLKQKSMMPADKQQQQEEAFRAEEQQILGYREQRLNDLNVKREEFLEPIRKKIKISIEDVAKSENLKLVLDKSSSVVLYYEDKMDITFLVLDKIKRGAK